jgi:hypothetical protein
MNRYPKTKMQHNSTLETGAAVYVIDSPANQFRCRIQDLIAPERSDSTGTKKSLRLKLIIISLNYNPLIAGRLSELALFSGSCLWALRAGGWRPTGKCVLQSVFEYAMYLAQKGRYVYTVNIDALKRRNSNG